MYMLCIAELCNEKIAIICINRTTHLNTGVVLQQSITWTQGVSMPLDKAGRDGHHEVFWRGAAGTVYSLLGERTMQMWSRWTAAVIFGLWSGVAFAEDVPAEADVPDWVGADPELIELWKLCDGGEMSQCTVLGTRFDDGYGGMRRDPLRAAILFKMSCEGGEVDGCYNFGLLYSLGRGVRQNAPRAGALFQMACDGGHAGGCTDLGLMYSMGLGVASSNETAAELFEQGCTGGNMSGCYNLGLMYIAGRGVDMDQIRAVELFQQACDGDGGQKACDAVKQYRR